MAGNAQVKCVPNLEDHHVSARFAFLLSHPLTELPEYYHPWMTIVINLEEFISSGSIREKILAMPLLDHSHLSGHKQWRLAHLILSCLTQGYVWVDGENGIPEVLPKQLAIPLAEVSKHLGVQPIICVTNFGLCNWKLKDPSKPVEFDNMEAIFPITGGSDSNWFFTVYFAVELECGPGLGAIVDAQQAVKDGNSEMVKVALEKMENSLHRMKNAMSRMHALPNSSECSVEYRYKCTKGRLYLKTEKCAPEAFFNKLRPFLSGWDGPAFQRKHLDGLIYEGVSKSPMRLVGGTAAQSSTVPSFDAALGVDPPAKEKILLDTFRNYMLPAHRDFIEAIKDGPSIKSYVISSEDSSLREMYNRCLTALQRFRSYHIQLTSRYIVAQANKNKTEKAEDRVLAGTGGTGFMEFLKNLRDNTKNTAIEN